jgi:CDP-diacylglycerol---glycerol-3-phosphate 3-phosphatidyltransferase
MAEQERIKGKFNRVLLHPNNLTMFRVLAIPLLIVLLMYDNRPAAILAALVFTIAAITDYLDGYIARRYALISSLGKILDPLADKMLVSTAFIMLVSLDRVPAWLVCIIIGRELAITGFRNVISEHGDDASASMLGKYKTGFQIAALIPLLIHFKYLGIDFHTVGSLLLWIALVFTIWSGIDYIVRFRRYIEY